MLATLLLEEQFNLLPVVVVAVKLKNDVRQQPVEKSWWQQLLFDHNALQKDVKVVDCH